MARSGPKVFVNYNILITLPQSKAAIQAKRMSKKNSYVSISVFAIATYLVCIVEKPGKFKPSFSASLYY